MDARPLEVRAFFDFANSVGRSTLVDMDSLGVAATVRSVARRLGLPDGRVGFAMVNGRVADLDASVEPGDRVALFPEYVPFHKIYGTCVL